MRNRGSILAITFTIGLLCAGWAFYHLYRNWKLSDDAVRTTATVMYLDTRIDSIRGEISRYHRVNDYSDECYKTLVYHTKGGEKIVWQSFVSVDMPDFMRAEDVEEEHAATILYDPEDPHYWEYENVMSMFVNWFMLLLAGLALMSIPFGPYDAVMKRLRESDEEREERLAPIRQELYAPTKKPANPVATEPRTVSENRLRSAPPGVDEDAPMSMMDDDIDGTQERAYAQTGDWGNSSADDPFADMR